MDRAVRAADMAGHGLSQMGTRRSDTGTEAQTAPARDAGLRHAREAVTRIMMSVAKLTPAEVNAMPATATRNQAIVTPPVDEDILGGAEEA
ncbi:MAG: hypothetical protein U0838_01895 [Chloroflexota bacterium]